MKSHKLTKPKPNKTGKAIKSIKSSKPVKVGICVDLMGGDGKSAEEEIAQQPTGGSWREEQSD